MRVLQKTIDMIEQDKDRAIHIYEIMLAKMADDDGNLVVLSQMADRYLEQASRATDNIIRLANVMQKLKAAKESGKKGASDFKDILNELDLEGKSPFMQKDAKGDTVVVAPQVGGAEDVKITDAQKQKENSEKKSNTGNNPVVKSYKDLATKKPESGDEEIQLETDFE